MTPVPRSLRGRLIGLAVLVIAVALAITGVAMDLALRRFIQGQVDGRLDSQILSIRDALRGQPDGTLALERTVDGPPFERPLSGWYWTVRGDGADLRSPSLRSGDLALDDVVPAGPPRPVTLDGRGPRDEALRVRAQRFAVGARVVTVAASAPLGALVGPLHEVMAPLAVTLAVLAALLIGGALLQVRLGLTPLVRLKADLTRVRTGQAERIDGTPPREIAPLVAELNTLLDQNAANLARARRHVANLAHGLKTPLATLSLMLGESGRDPDGELGTLVTLMDRRIRHHLSRARLAALGGPERTRADLGARVADHVAVFGKLYADKHLGFTVAVAPELAVACDKQDLDEMIGNLLDNACKWAAHAVRVRAAVTGDARTELTVEDDGPGLGDGDAQSVLRPGHRLDEAVPGHGFGLPITQELAELYGGSLQLGRAPLGGVLARVSLPTAR